VIVLRRPWRVQPLGAVEINPSHPLAAYLAFCVPFTEQGNRPRELVTGKLPAHTTAPTTFVTVANSGGPQGRAPDSSGRLEYGRTPMDDLTNTTGFTLVFQGGFDTNATTTAFMASGENGAGNGFGIAWDDIAGATNGLTTTRDNSGGPSSSFDIFGANAETRTYTGAWSLDATDARFFCQ